MQSNFVAIFAVNLCHWQCVTSKSILIFNRPDVEEVEQGHGDAPFMS